MEVMLSGSTGKLVAFSFISVDHLKSALVNSNAHVFAVREGDEGEGIETMQR